MSVWIFGQRDAGRVEELDGTYVETRYTHVNFFPLNTNGSILRLGDQSYRIPAHRPSALAGYGRFYCIILSVAAGGFALAHDGATTIVLGGLAVFLFVLWLRAMRAGRLSADELAQRRVYRSVTGFSADPALLVHANPTLAKHLHADLATRAERLAPDGYRDALVEWSSVATHGGEADLPFLALALTLARIEGRPEIHRAVWDRLARLASSLPNTIAPLTQLEMPVAAAPQQQTWQPAPPPTTLAKQRGSLIEQGFDVTFPRTAYQPPPLCASCLAPAHVMHPSFKHDERVDLPYCSSCSLHASREGSSNHLPRALTVGAGLACSALALISGPSAPLSLAIVFVGASVVAFAMAYALPARRAAAPATVTLDAARLVAADDGNVTIFCRNEEWSQRLAEHFGGTRRENKRVNPRALRAPAIAVVLALGGGGLAWHLNNPTLRVDNGTGAPVSLWIDGRVVEEVPPTKNAGTTDLRVPRGAHTLGWSKVGAPSPTETVNASIAFLGGDYLFDPAAHHCYLVEPMVYGDGSADAQYVGARAVGLFHDFSFVNDWFVPSPAQVQLRNGDRGTVRYALTRGNCEWVRACPKGVREKYWSCLVGATESGIDRCKKDAALACGLVEP